VLAAVAACALSGCGGGSKHAASTSRVVVGTDTLTVTEPTRHELAQEYLRIIGPMNAEFARFQAKAKGWDDNTTGPEAAEDAAPVIAAIRKGNNELLRVSWSTSTMSDVKEMVRADGALIGDLAGLAGVDLFSVGNWSSQFTQDAGRLQAAVNIVRADLGLPPSDS